MALGHGEAFFGFVKVTTVQSRSNLSICAWEHLFSLNTMLDYISTVGCLSSLFNSHHLPGPQIRVRN